MVLVALEYTYDGVTRTFILDVNNADQFDSMRRKFIWAAHMGVEITIRPTSISTKQADKAA